jgi:hypothetical protein
MPLTGADEYYKRLKQQVITKANLVFLKTKIPLQVLCGAIYKKFLLIHYFRKRWLLL